MIWWILGSAAYLAVACLFFYVIAKLKKRLSNRKHYAKHPEKIEDDFGGTTTDLICSLLWPLQIIGLLAYGMKG